MRIYLAKMAMNGLALSGLLRFGWAHRLFNWLFKVRIDAGEYKQMGGSNHG